MLTLEGWREGNRTNFLLLQHFLMESNSVRQEVIQPTFLKFPFSHFIQGKLVPRMRNLCTKVTNQQEKEECLGFMFSSLLLLLLRNNNGGRENFMHITQIQKIALGLHMIHILLARPLESLPKGGRTETAI